MSTHFFKMVGCRLQGNHKKHMARKRGYYIFSMYLICSQFSNVEMFLALLAKIALWVCLGKKHFIFFFVNEENVQVKRTREMFFSKRLVSTVPVYQRIIF